MAGQIIRRIISTPKAPVPIAPYNQAVQVNETLYVSGQLGTNLDGKLVEGIEAQTNLALQNLGHILTAAGTNYNNVVKTTVYLADLNTFQAVNKIYQQYFTKNFPARVAFEVSSLPLKALVEIEAVAIVGDVIDRN